MRKSIKLVPITLIAALFVLGSCDFKITNPGPIDDSLLNDASTFPSIINGMRKTLASAQNNIGYITAAVTKEYTAAGSVSSYGITHNERAGKLYPTEEHVNSGWNAAQQARWVAEDGVRRITEVLGSDYNTSEAAAEALIWDGYAHRLLGENMCVAVFDGGPAQPNELYFRRAEEVFTEAINILQGSSNNLLFAAYGGRASVRVFLGDWTGAVSDANQVPLDYVFVSGRSSIQTSEYNQFVWGNANQPYRAHSVVDTYYEDYYTNYGDPRVSWDTDPDIAVGDGGVVPWLFQTKYTKTSDPVNLSSGREMVLIRAEKLLRDTDWNGAMTLINSLRADLGAKHGHGSVADWTAASETEAWTRLKRERGIELWLEARRMGDLRRWIADNTPGDVEDMTGRDLCYPPGQSEQERNPNLN